VRYAREQDADVERMKSQIEDLKGLRRDTVRIACSQAVAHHFLPSAIAAFRERHPLVVTAVAVLDHERAMAALAAYKVDLVLVFRPPYLATFRPLMRLQQRLVVLMPKNAPACVAACRQTAGLCVLPGGVARPQHRRPPVARRGLGQDRPAPQHRGRIEPFEFLRGLVYAGVAISFQIEIGATVDGNRGLVARKVDDRDLPRADLVLGQLRGRSLPVAAAVFAERLIKNLETLQRG
jgi:DNA-binding transcriptional LysR family regulator